MGRIKANVDKIESQSTARQAGSACTQAKQKYKENNKKIFSSVKIFNFLLSKYCIYSEYTLLEKSATIWHTLSQLA